MDELYIGSDQSCFIFSIAMNIMTALRTRLLGAIFVIFIFWIFPLSILAYNTQANDTQELGSETTFVFMFGEEVVPNGGTVTISEYTDYDFMIEMQAAVYIKNVSEDASKLTLTCVGKDNYNEIEFCPNGNCMAWNEIGELTINYANAVAPGANMEQGNNWLHAMVFDTKSYKGSVELKAYCTNNPSDCAIVTILFDTDGVSTSIPIVTGSCGDNVSYAIYPDMSMVISGIGSMKNYGYNEHINEDYYQSVKKVIIEEGITTIGDNAFYDYICLQSVKIPNSVTIIGYGAFEFCEALTSITIPNSVIYIERLAFYWSGLTSITLPNSVTIMGNQVFEGCKNLSLVNIGSGLNSIGVGSFSNCKSIASIRVDSANKTYDSRNDCNAIIETKSNQLIVGCKNTVIPNSVTSIGDYAFYCCTGLTLLTLPNSVTSIGYSAFSDCSGLTSLTIPNSVTTIHNNAFFRCISLKNLEIPNKVSFLGEGAFSGCNGLVSIIVSSANPTYDSRDNCNAIIETSNNTIIVGCNSTVIPNSVTSIGDYAFNNLLGLSSLMIPNNVTRIGESAFSYCSDLASLSIPNSVTSIGEFAFSYCFGLTTVTIPNCITSVNSYVFTNCTGLTSVTIPKNVTEIGYETFANCRSLTSVILENETPISISNSTFKNVNMSTCSLYVPKGSKSTYEDATFWNEFNNIVEYELDPDTDISTLDNAIYVDQTEGRVGGTMDIPIKLKNNYAVRGFQFTMELPEGAIINNWSLSSARMPEGVTMSDMIATRKIEGSKITVACSLNYGNATFTGNDGEIATVNVTFGEDVEVGTYPIYLTACDVTTAGGTDEDLSDVKASLVLEDYVVGDANGDGKVRIGDATTILNYIVGAPSDNFKEKAADANGDGKIRIGDATTILNIIVNQ